LIGGSRVYDLLVRYRMNRIYFDVIDAMKRIIRFEDHEGFYTIWFRASKESIKRGSNDHYIVTASNKGFKCTCPAAVIEASRKGDEKGWRTICKHVIASAFYLEKKGLLRDEMLVALGEALQNSLEKDEKISYERRVLTR
jgi:predicted nucleic acid-binding Zn finger protein